MDAGDWKEWPLPGPPKLRYTASDVARWLEMDEKTLQRMIDDGHFPRGVKDSPRAEQTWTGGELAAWLLLRGRWFPAAPEDTDGHGGTQRPTGGHRRKSDDDPK